MKSIGLASLKVGSKFTVVALFYFVFLGQLSKYKPPGGLYLEGQFNGGFFWATSLGGLYLERLIFGILRYTLHFLSFPSIHLSLLLTFHSNDIFVCHPHQTLSAQTE